RAPPRQAFGPGTQPRAPTAVIAQDLGLQPRTARRLRQRGHDHGRDALLPSYDACGRPRTQAYQALHEEAVALRKEHPTWGAGLLRVVLRRHHPRANLPSERPWQRWLHQEGLGPAPKGRRPTARATGRAPQPQATW